MKISYKFTLLCISLFLLSAISQGRAEDSNPRIPSSAHEIEDSMSQEFSQEIAPETKLSELVKSSEVSLKVRNYFLNRDKPTAIDSYGWAQGGILSHKMGRVGGFFSMNTELMGSFPLVAPDEHTGTLLVDKYQNELVNFGVVNPRLTAEGQVLSLYRQRYNLPYVNEQDNRMLPNTFEGYTIGQPIGTSKKFQYIAGYIDSMKKRDSDRFYSMSDSAGVKEIERGMLLGGARVYFVPDWSLSAINYYVEDIFNIAYADSSYKFKLGEKVEQTLSAQYSTQSSVGDDLLYEDVSSTGFWGLQSASSYEGFVLKLALNSNDDAALIQSPFGSYPGYNSSIVEDFNRAGEESLQLALSYDLAKVGLNGFKIAAAYIQGNDAIDSDSRENLADKNEADLTLDYKVSEGLLNGLWLRLRSATIEDEESGTTQDYRVIVNYDIALVTPDKPTI